MATQYETKHDDTTTRKVKVVKPILRAEDGGAVGVSVGGHEMVGAGVVIIGDVEGAKVLGQQIDSAFRANSQSSDMLSNCTTISLAMPQVVSSEKGIIADSSMLTSVQNLHFVSTTGVVTDGGGMGASIDGYVVGVKVEI